MTSDANATWPRMLAALGSAQDTIITHSHTPIERGSITERVKRRVARMRAAEDIAATIAAQLFGECGQKVRLNFRKE